MQTRDVRSAAEKENLSKNCFGLKAASRGALPESTWFACEREMLIVQYAGYTILGKQAEREIQRLNNSLFWFVAPQDARKTVVSWFDVSPRPVCRSRIMCCLLWVISNNLYPKFDQTSKFSRKCSIQLVSPYFYCVPYPSTIQILLEWFPLYHFSQYLFSSASTCSQLFF